jgi:hypothetical protein
MVVQDASMRQKTKWLVIEGSEDVESNITMLQL